jgi:hypothetical protein
MSILRKLALLSVMALAAMAFSATSASATPLEVQHESTGVHCGFTPNTDCNVHAQGEDSLEIFGITLSTCQTEFNAEIFEDGTGWIHANFQDHPTDGDCTRIECNGVNEPIEEAEFEILSGADAPEETGTNAGTMVVRFCLDDTSNPDETGIHCTAPVTVLEPTLHDYNFRLNHVCPNLVHVIGDYTIEGSPIEIEHL